MFFCVCRDRCENLEKRYKQLNEALERTQSWYLASQDNLNEAQAELKSLAVAITDLNTKIKYLEEVILTNISRQNNAIMTLKEEMKPEPEKVESVSINLLPISESVPLKKSKLKPVNPRDILES